MDPMTAARVTVRQVHSGDLPRLLLGAGPHDRRHHEERSWLQERGEATYLVAWNGDLPCDRVPSPEVPAVRDILGDIPEMNALVATPTGFGIGSLLIASAEERAASLGTDRIGLAVEHGNVAARRLYERLGYAEWEHGDVVDRWQERNAGGQVVREHADLCSYLVKDLTSIAAEPQ